MRLNPKTRGPKLALHRYDGDTARRLADMVGPVHEEPDDRETRGQVVRVWRYPVKSMLGEECAHLVVNERGVMGDRLFAVRDVDGKFGSAKTTRRFRKIDGLFGFRAE